MISTGYRNGIALLLCGALLRSSSASGSYPHNQKLAKIDAQVRTEFSINHAWAKMAHAELVKVDKSGYKHPAKTAAALYDQILRCEATSWRLNEGGYSERFLTGGLRRRLEALKLPDTYEVLKAKLLTREISWGTRHDLDIGKALLLQDPDDDILRINLIPVVLGNSRGESERGLAAIWATNMLAKYPEIPVLRMFLALAYLQDANTHPSRTKEMLLKVIDQYEQYALAIHATRADQSRLFNYIDTITKRIARLN